MDVNAMKTLSTSFKVILQAIETGSWFCFKKRFQDSCSRKNIRVVDSSGSSFVLLLLCLEKVVLANQIVEPKNQLPSYSMSKLHCQLRLMAILWMFSFVVYILHQRSGSHLLRSYVLLWMCVTISLMIQCMLYEVLMQQPCLSCKFLQSPGVSILFRASMYT